LFVSRFDHSCGWWGDVTDWIRHPWLIKSACLRSPAQAGIHRSAETVVSTFHWVPAFAGTTTWFLLVIRPSPGRRPGHLLVIRHLPGRRLCILLVIPAQAGIQSTN
jgi:hypothetical protein